MIIISTRDKFTDPDKFSQASHYLAKELNGDPWDHNFIENGELMVRLAAERILLLVHGYNNEFDEMADAYATVAAKASGMYDMVLGFSWPGGDRGYEWLSAKSRANAAALRLRKFLEDISEHVSAIDIMSHSLGGRVTLRALRGCSAQIRNYYATAPAVDNEALEPGEEFSRKKLSCENIFVMHSRRDPVLKAAYKLAEWDNALGLTGPENPGFVLDSEGLFVVNCKNMVRRHGGYKHCQELFSYIKASHADAVDRFTTL